jgi:hypothetical protein
MNRYSRFSSSHAALDRQMARVENVFVYSCILTGLAGGERFG